MFLVDARISKSRGLTKRVPKVLRAFSQTMAEDDGGGLQFKKATGARRRGRRDKGDDGAEAEEEEEGIVVVAPRAKRASRTAASDSRGAKPGGGAGATVAVVHQGGAATSARDNVTVEAKEKDADEDESGRLQETVGGEKMYAGEKARATFFRTGEKAKGTAGLKAGPIKASTFIRSATLVDYNPSVCKDYKQTGFCGYGQNCIYVHDRGDYKSGWEIDKEWAAKQKRGGEEENYEIHSDSDDDGELPFACFICRQPFQQPVVTKCGHYFCEQCALDQEKKTKRCAVCNEPTSGIFNEPKALNDRLAKKKRSAIE